MADDEEPYEFPARFHVHQVGVSIPITEADVPSWERTLAIVRDTQELQTKLFWWTQRLDHHNWHDRYMPAGERPWSPDHPKCDLCTWPWRIWFFWHEVRDYVDAYGKA